ncbi:uncharacterized protein MYCGRDRAFT_85300 [Zymoseptoria tritici IPO323]|uniref:RRM domain-containing protein n=1 Tax=Zymoseptoria tritici (strain CBS 115943 / IPO323) TaxID=336722 RepID=F9X792_ZYMTI|nr:uncharacterized protein MYCGRDRAFT_85300 [Zymoseptoria tritici IPO323]EGP89310.1 hypothetical protein MYCGRDRAFT_85300 [Zymoseptoria tritici IPO323]
MEAPARVRLHITPFNPSLLDRYVPDSLKPQASNISFHTVETFPERGFGYVELPTTEAQKLKAKLNGMTLKGAKVKIEEARPEKKRKSSEAIDGEDVEEEKPRKKSKKDKTEKKEKKKEKPKRTEKVLTGYVLDEGRHVKRGWAEETGKSKTGKKEKEGKKLKFKTSVDENKMVVDEPKEKKDKKEKKEKKEKSKHGHKKEVVVTEFAKSTKLNFPNVKGETKDLTYEEGQGWVDKEGNVVEAEPSSKKRKRSKVAKEPKPVPVEDAAPAADSPLGSVSEMIQTPPPAEDQSQKEVHPLEALFKRAPPTASSSNEPTAQTESFGFFGNTADDSSEDEAENMRIDIPAANTLSALQTAPQTPHTKRDLEWRSIRSAAPTPDTAAIGKRFEFPPTINGYDDEEAEEEAQADDGEGNATVGAEDKKNAGREGESEFRQWFYQNRGDLNRAWKKRRKEERKVERQRENRRVGRKMA